MIQKVNFKKAICSAVAFLAHKNTTTKEPYYQIPSKGPFSPRLKSGIQNYVANRMTYKLYRPYNIAHIIWAFD